MVVDDVSLPHEVDFLTNHSLNGPYWNTYISSDNRCGDMSGIDINVQRCVTRSMRKRSGDASSTTSATIDDSDFIDEDGDLMMDEMDGIRGDDRVTQRLPNPSALNSSDEEGKSDYDDDDDLSVMSDITVNSNIHSGADSSNPLLGGLDVCAADVCAERLQRMSILEVVAVMDVDDDAASVAYERYLLRSTLVSCASQKSLCVLHTCDG